jgi:hypothetical protein
MRTDIPEHSSRDLEAEKAAAETRTGYQWILKADLWVSHFPIAFRWYRSMNREFRKAHSKGLTFGRYSRTFRALRCYSAVLDDVAGDAWEHTASLSETERWLGFHGTYVHEHIQRAERELRRRGLIWKDADRDLLFALYQMFRGVGDKATDPTPNEWNDVSASIRLSRTQVNRCKRAISNQRFVGESWVSLHFDVCHFDGCVFSDCDLSNASFASSLFTSCTFSNILMVNARLTGAAFSDCEFRDVDLGGAMLENVRFWHRNRLSRIKVDPFTRVAFPLVEECELSYELAARNYGLFRSWYSDAGLRSERSDSAFREQYCLSQSYPYGRERLRLLAYRLLSGYNERPARFSLWLAVVMFGFAAAYKAVGLNKSTGATTFVDTLYFSVVTFTTLGYGDIAPTNNVVAQLLVIGEVALGVLGIAYLTALVIRRLL